MLQLKGATKYFQYSAKLLRRVKMASNVTVKKQPILLKLTQQIATIKLKLFPPFWQLLWSPYVIGQTIIFSSFFFFFLLFYFLA